MSVEVQAPHDHKQFGINSTEFKEIVPVKREEPSSSNVSSTRKEMEKASDSEQPPDKDGEKQRKESSSKSNYSSDGHGSYDDDFEDTPTPKTVQQKPATRKSTSPRRQRQMSNSSLQSPEISTAKSPSILSHRSSKKSKKKLSNTYGRYASPRSSSPASSRPPEKGWQRSNNRSAHIKLSRLDESVVDRVLSANRHKVQKLESRLSQLVKELSFERDEIKTLRQIHYRQEKELTQVNNDEAELPRLLEKHTTEVKSLRERVRKLHETTTQKDNKLNHQNKEILKLKDRCKHYKDLCEMENLTERADLQKKLTETQTGLEKKDSEISKLQRMIKLKEKAHARHLREEKEKLRETESKCNTIEENYNNLQARLKEKEKQLNYTNIYQRQIVLKEKNQSSPEVMAPKMAALPAPKKPKSKKANNVTKNKNNNNINDNKEKPEDELEMNTKPDSFFMTAHSDTGSSDKELDKSTGKAEDDKQLSITRGGNVDMHLLNKNKTVEEEMAENKQREKEEFERSLREEDERLKKEKEDFETKKKEMEEREERGKVEREAKWREDSARRAREQDEQRQESARRRKEEEDERRQDSARRRREEEDERRKTEEQIKENERKKSDEMNKEDSFFNDDETRTKKDQLLARLKAIDNEKDPYQSDSKRSSSGKSGHETKHVDDKLLNGLPPLKTSMIVSPPLSVKSDPDGVFGIPKSKPVLLGRGSLVKKSGPFSWLDDNNNKRQGGNNAKQNNVVGDYSPSTSKNKSGNLEGDMFGGQRVGRRREKVPSGENGFDFGERRGSGGFEKPKNQNNLPFLLDDFGNKKKGDAARSISPLNNEPLLPRRRKVQEKGAPAISSVFDDNLDNDIEELTL